MVTTKQLIAWCKSALFILSLITCNSGFGAEATAEAVISTIPIEQDTQPVKATALLDGSRSTPTDIQATSFAEADLATGTLKALSKVSIAPYSGGLVISSTSTASFNDVLTFKRTSGTGNWLIELPATITLGPDGFSGSASAFFSASLLLSSISFYDSASTFTSYTPDTFASDQKVFAFAFTIPGSVSSVNIELTASLNAFANACVPSGGFPDECSDAGQTSDPVADFASSAVFSISTSPGVTITSESGAFLKEELPPSPPTIPATMPMPWLPLLLD